MKKLLCIAAVAALLVSTTTVISIAGDDKHAAQTRPDITIVIDGEETWFKSATGESIYPILYNDTTYLPLRSIGEIMGKNVNWDESTKTITISGQRTDYSDTSKKTNADRENIEIEVRDDFNIIIDGTKCTFKDANGKTVYPILWEGSTYLPIRSIGDIMGSSVGWNDDTKTVTLTSETTVTDADTFNQTAQTTTGTDGLITLDSAKAAAAKDAGAAVSDVTFIKAYKEYDDRRWEYEVDFVYNGYEYDYTINAQNGNIISKEIEAVYGATTGTSAAITQESAKAVALSDAGANESSITLIKSEKDYDDGVLEYKFEFLYNGYKYDYTINAQTGKIKDKEVEIDKSASSTTGDIGLEGAKSTAAADAGFTVSEVTFTKAEKDYDDGRLVYEIEFVKDRREYEYKISADTGKVIDKEVDYND